MKVNLIDGMCETALTLLPNAKLLTAEQFDNKVKQILDSNELSISCSKKALMRSDEFKDLISKYEFTHLIANKDGECFIVNVETSKNRLIEAFEYIKSKTFNAEFVSNDILRIYLNMEKEQFRPWLYINIKTLEVRISDWDYFIDTKLLQDEVDSFFSKEEVIHALEVFTEDSEYSASELIEQE